MRMTIVGALAVLTAVGSTLAIGAYPRSASAQTQGMERRAEGRAAKQACKGSGDKSRAECRQTKRATKHGGGSAENPATSPEKSAPPAANAPPPGKQ